MTQKGRGWWGEPKRHSDVARRSRIGTIPRGRLRFAAPSKSERMPLAGSYNAFGHPGAIVKNPPATVRLEGSDMEYGIGGGAPSPNPREAAEWLYMWEREVKFGDVRDVVKKDDPVLVITSTEGVERIHASGLRAK